MLTIVPCAPADQWRHAPQAETDWSSEGPERGHPRSLQGLAGSCSCRAPSAIPSSRSSTVAVAACPSFSYVCPPFSLQNCVCCVPPRHRFFFSSLLSLSPLTPVSSCADPSPIIFLMCRKWPHTGGTHSMVPPKHQLAPSHPIDPILLCGCICVLLYGCGQFPG